MSIEISPPHVDELKPRIAVIGVGGAGGNAIANMIAASVEGVDFIVANTDAQALNSSPAERRIQLGPQITEGLGAGSRPEIGKAAAEETIASVEQALDGAHMCFITAGMGGGTGTGAAPVIAKAARDRGILTVGVVTKPFTFEGNRRMKSAEAGIDELQKHVDTLIVIPNQNLFLIANPNTTFKEAFQMADEVLQQGVRSITDLMIMPGLINLDFADVRSVMGEMGKAMMGTGEAEGDGRALQAAEKAIANPLLDGVSMRGAKGVIVSIVGGEDMRLMEVDEAANHIRELVDPDANIIWGSAFNDNLNGKIRVSVVATGIDNDVGAQAAPLTQPFSFASRPAVAVPQAAAPKAAPTPQPAPVAAPAPQPEPETLELDVPEAPAPAEALAPFAAPKPAAVFSDEGPEGDELILGADNAESAPAAPQPAPRVATGGTLFERMAGLTRGSEKGVDEAVPGVDIPRFLNRQSNQ
ncbi:MULTISPECIES: cell division protein FtsZ [unclassified Sphingobium]|uniref:cell division protein FtsZ n=1 Tax=unclassified Sphingobium TaxID=2611147 RepID=UPI0035A5E277